MNLNLENKNVVIIGGSRGIGLAISKAFIHENAKVYVISRKEGDLKNPSIEYFQADASNQNSLAIAKDKILNKTKNKIDIVISNVGDGSNNGNPLKDRKVWDESWGTNFITGLNSAMLFNTVLKDNKGVLLFTSSIAGIEEIGAPIPYSIAKSSLISFSKSLSYKLAPEVRVNVVVPGNIFFKGGTWETKQMNDSKAVDEMLNAQVPLKRFGKPEEVADFVLFLSSSKASFITGGCFVIDGGQTKSF